MAARLSGAADDVARAGASTVRWVGGVPSEEGLRLVDSARRSLRVAESRNIAFAESVIEGRSRQLLTGVSGGSSPLGTVAAPTNRQFWTLVNRGAIRTDVDSEVKILEKIAENLSRRARGTINLFSERLPCESCQFVIEQFKAKFRNITLDVTHGWRGAR